MLARRGVALVALCMTLAFVACGGEPETEMEADTAMAEMEEMAADPLAGTYEMEMGTVVMADGSYTYQAAEGDSVLVEGRYQIRGDTVVFIDSSGPIACPGDRGVYTFVIVDGEPDLTLVSDPCEGRRNEITGGQEEGGDA